MSEKLTVAEWEERDRAAWERRGGRFAIPEDREEQRALRLAEDEKLPLIEAMHRISYNLRAALELFISPVFAQSVAGANAEAILKEASALVQHLVGKKP